MPRIDENGIREEELAIEYSLIDAAAELGTGIYITGCNYVDSLSYYENCSFAIAYFEKLIAYGKKKNIKLQPTTAAGITLCAMRKHIDHSWLFQRPVYQI